MAEVTEEGSSHIADLGWTKIHYNDAGSGEVVILLHGGGLGASSWSNFILNIGTFAERCRVLAVDAPGFGKSDPLVLRDEPRTTVAARAVRDLMDSLGIPRASLVGNSMGGATSLTFAVDYPDRVNKVVMMGAAPVGQTSVFTPMLPTEGIKALFHVYQDPSLESFRKMFDLMVYDSSSVPDEALAKRAATVDEVHRKNYIAGQAKGFQRDLLAALRGLTTPVLLIHGRNDTMSPLENSMTLLPLLENAEMHIFNQCGHWAQYEHAGKFNRMVLDFLLNDD